METEFWYILAIGLVIFCVSLGFAFSMYGDYRFRAELANRPPLNNDEFIAQFYADSEIPSEIPLRLRPIYGNYFEIDPDKIHPDDLPPDIGEFDTKPLVDAIEKEFGITINDDEQERTTGEFASIVKCVCRIIHK